MSINTYGLVILFMILFIVQGILGAQFGYTVSGTPEESGSIMTYLGNMLTFKIDNMPDWYSALWYIVPVILALIIYRQLRGQD